MSDVDGSQQQFNRSLREPPCWPFEASTTNRLFAGGWQSGSEGPSRPCAVDWRDMQPRKEASLAGATFFPQTRAVGLYQHYNSIVLYMEMKAAADVRVPVFPGFWLRG